MKVNTGETAQKNCIEVEIVYAIDGSGFRIMKYKRWLLVIKKNRHIQPLYQGQVDFFGGQLLWWAWPNHHVDGQSKIAIQTPQNGGYGGFQLEKIRNWTHVPLPHIATFDFWRVRLTVRPL